MSKLKVACGNCGGTGFALEAIKHVGICLRPCPRCNLLTCSHPVASSSPNTESDKSIDDLIQEIYQIGFQVGQYTQSPDHTLENRLDKAKDQLYSLLMDVIGEEVKYPEVMEYVKLLKYSGDNRDPIYEAGYKMAISEQRQKLNQLFGKELVK